MSLLPVRKRLAGWGNFPIEECSVYRPERRAELEELVTSSRFTAFAEGRALVIGDLIDTARDMVPLAVTMDDRLKELREWARPRARPASLDRRRIDLFEEWGEAG
mgnify:CR=1 FL=1